MKPTYTRAFIFTRVSDQAQVSEKTAQAEAGVYFPNRLRIQTARLVLTNGEPGSGAGPSS
jgi:hypothetical protein